MSGLHAECPECEVRWPTRGVDEDQRISCPFCGFEFTFHAASKRTATLELPDNLKFEDTAPMGVQDDIGLGEREIPTDARITLEVVDGPHKGKKAEIKSDRVVLGRYFEGVEISDPRISRKHAVLEIHGDRGMLLRDLASLNGTCVNDKLIAQIRVKDGDVIRLGTTEFLLRVESE